MDKSFRNTESLRSPVSYSHALPGAIDVRNLNHAGLHAWAR